MEHGAGVQPAGRYRCGGADGPYRDRGCAADGAAVPKLSQRVVTPALHGAATQYSTTVFAARRDRRRITHTAHCDRDTPIRATAIAQLTQVIETPTLYPATAEHGVGVEGTGRYGDGVADALHCYGDGSVLCVATANLAVVVVAPALPASATQYCAAMAVTRRDSYSVGNATHLHGAVTAVPAAVAKLARTVFSLALHLPVGQQGAGVEFTCCHRGDFAEPRYRHRKTGARSGVVIALLFRVDVSPALHPAIAVYGAGVVAARRDTGCGEQRRRSQECDGQQ